MKKNRVLIFLLIAVMMTGNMLLASCTGAVEPINVTLIIEAGEDEILNVTMPIDVANPTVMNLVQEAAIVYELNITYNDNVDSVMDIEQYKYRTDDTGITYFWEYLINGTLPENTTGGKANAQAITDGMVVKYIYSSYNPNTAK